MRKSVKQILIIGADFEIIELIEESSEFKVAGIIDNKQQGVCFGYKVVGSDDNAEGIIKRLKIKQVAITIDDCKITNALCPACDRRRCRSLDASQRKAKKKTPC